MRSKNDYQWLVQMLAALGAIISLSLVAYEMKQSRDVAVAELNTAQLEAFASRFEAGLGSDVFLTMWSKQYATDSWETNGMSNLEIAAAEIDAVLFWNYAEMTFEHYREGLVTEEAWGEFTDEVLMFYHLPAMEAVYRVWYSKVPTGFSRAIDELITSSHE
jgi:hypothetical protein